MGDGALLPRPSSTLPRSPCGAVLARSRTAWQIDLSGRVVVFESLKKRRRGIFRVVPVPPELLDTRLASQAQLGHQFRKCRFKAAAYVGVAGR